MYPPAVARGVRDRSHDCIAAQEFDDLRAFPDLTLWEWAQANRRLLVTENAREFVPGGRD